MTNRTIKSVSTKSFRRDRKQEALMDAAPHMLTLLEQLAAGEGVHPGDLKFVLGIATSSRRSWKDEVVERFCELSREAQQFIRVRDGDLPAADCFCFRSDDRHESEFQYEQRVSDFIEQAVREKIAREQKGEG
jgi:hypothetical protein